MTAHAGDFTNASLAAYADIREHLRTGDLLLCSGSSAMSGIIRRATGSRWSHVALIARLESIDRVLVLESVESIGVRCVPLSHYLGDAAQNRRGYEGELLIARHQSFAGLDDDRLRSMFSFAADALGRRYDSAEVLRIASRITSGFASAVINRVASGIVPGQREQEQSRSPIEHDDAYICSEYVWECLHEGGIDIVHDDRGFIAPRDFAADPLVQPLWMLQPNLQGHGDSAFDPPIGGGTDEFP